MRRRPRPRVSIRPATSTPRRSTAATSRRSSCAGPSRKPASDRRAPLISRRGFLLGGLGVATAGIGGTGVAATTHRGRRLLHAAGLLDTGDHRAPRSGVRVEYRTLESEAMRGPVSYAVASPAPGAPLVYALHGR